MKYLVLILFANLLVAAETAPETKLPASVQSAMKAYQSDTDKIRADADDAVAKKTKAFKAVLEKAVIDATKAGNLDGALAIKAQLVALGGNEVVEKKSKDISATLFVCCDDEFEVYQNGNKILFGSDCDRSYQSQISIKAGDVFAVKAINTKGAYGFGLAVISASGETLLTSNSDDWKSFIPSKSGQWYDMSSLRIGDLHSVVYGNTQAPGMSTVRDQSKGQTRVIWGNNSDTAYLVCSVK